MKIIYTFDTAAASLLIQEQTGLSTLVVSDVKPDRVFDSKQDYDEVELAALDGYQAMDCYVRTEPPPKPQADLGVVESDDASPMPPSDPTKEP